MTEPQDPDIDGSDYSKLLAGHLGYLTTSQEKSLETFKQNLQKASLYNPKSDDGGAGPSHDDTTLLYVLSSSTFSGFVDVVAYIGDSFVPGSLMSIKRRSSLLTLVPGGRSTMSRIYTQHLTPRSWSQRRGSTLGGLAGEIR
jgi:hypothetical protein